MATFPFLMMKKRLPGSFCLKIICPFWALNIFIFKIRSFFFRLSKLEKKKCRSIIEAMRSLSFSEMAQSEGVTCSMILMDLETLPMILWPFLLFLCIWPVLLSRASRSVEGQHPMCDFFLLFQNNNLIISNGNAQKEYHLDFYLKLQVSLGAAQMACPFVDSIQIHQYNNIFNFLIIMKVTTAVAWLLCLALALLQAQSQSLSLSLGTRTINTASVYKIQIFDNNLQSFDGLIKLAFPTAYYPSLASVTTIYTDGNTSATYPFTVSASTITMTYTRGSSPVRAISFNISTVTNPGSIVQIQIGYTFSTGATTHTTSSTPTYSNFLAGSLTACSLSFVPATTHTSTVATLTVTVGNPVSAGGSVTIQYPSYWAGATSTTLYPPVTSSSSTCAKVSGSAVSSSFTCSVLSTSIMATSIFSSTISTAAGSFSYSMSNVRTPPTSSAANTVTVTTTTSLGNTVDSSTTCSVNVVSAQPISLSTTSAFTVGVSKELLLAWITNSPLMAGDTIQITVPQNYISFSSLLTVYITAGAYTLFLSPGTTSDPLVRTLTLNSFPDSLTEIPVSTAMQLNGVFMTCLLDTSPRSIQVTILRSTFQVAAGTLSLTPVSNSLTGVTISADVTTVSSAMTMSVSFSLSNALATTAAYLTVTMPASMQYVTSGIPTCVVSSTSNPSAVSASSICSFSSGQLLLTVNTFLLTSVPAGAVFTLRVSGLLVNPLTSQPTATFTIRTYSSSGFTIDASATTTYTATAGTIGSLAISRGSSVVGASTPYTFLYTLTRSIPAGSSVSIVLPPEIALATSPSYTYSLSAATPITIVPATCVDASGYVCLQFNGMVVSKLGVGATISIVASSLTNPASLKPSSSFAVKTEQSGYVVESISSGKTVTNTAMSAFRGLAQAVYLPTNGAQQSYNIYIKPLVPLYTNMLLTLAIVDTTSGLNALSFTTPISGCRIYLGTAYTENTCSLVNTELTITLKGDLSDASGATQYQLVVQSMKMARTMAATSNLLLTAYTSGGYGISQQTLTGIPTTVSNSVQAMSLSISTNPSQLNQAQTFSVGFTVHNGLYLLQGDYAVITIPQSYTYTGGASPSSICSTLLYTCSFHNGDQHSIKMSPSGSFTSTALTYSFTVGVAAGMYTSPASFAYSTDYFYVTTYTATGSVIDTSTPSLTPTTFYRSCGGFCKTCLPSNSSFCQSCYTVEGVNTYGGYNYLTSDGNCVDECGADYYNASGICTPCSDPCYGCSNTAIDCTSCLSGYFFDSTAATPSASCQPSCPIGYYGDSTSNTCKPCNSQCAQCTTTSITCTACPSSFYLFNSACSASCPFGYYADTALLECVACSISCFGCTLTAANCIACANNYYASGSSCVSQCPTGTVSNPINSQCECADGCATCQVELDQCTSCSDSSMVLYESSCLSACPSGSYLPSTSTQCSSCNFVFCSVCSSSACQVCQSGYYLHLGGCVLACPTSYFESSNQCQSCGIGCATCDDGVQCLTCIAPYLKEESGCVTACTGSYVNFNATQCLSVCPIGYITIDAKCEESSTPSPSSSTTTVLPNKVIPFPYSIAYCMIIIVCIAMKCLYSHTMLPSAVMSLGSLLEILSAVTFIIAAYIESAALKTGPVIVLIALAVNYICNGVNMFFVIKVLNNDKKFLATYKKTVCSSIFIRCISLLFSHKFHEIVFSNIFAVRVLSHKVEYVKKLYPFNVLLFISMANSVLCIVGAGITSYQVQALRMTSITFIWSVDCILVWILGMVATILVQRRGEADYEKEPDADQAKRYETQDQLNFNNDSCGFEDGLIEQSRVNYARESKNGQSRKNYFYQNSNKSIGGEDPYETPLQRKKKGNNNPITTARASRDIEDSSEALCIGQKNKDKRKIEEDSNEDIEEIVLEQPVGDNLVNISNPGQHTSPGRQSSPGKHSSPNKESAMINYVGYDLDPRLLEIPQSGEEFKKLPSETKAKIRLAKANKQINKNSSQLKPNTETIDQEIDEIQLSPKKKQKKKAHHSEEEGEDSGDREEGRRSDRKGLSKSKSNHKQKTKQVTINKSKSKSKSKSKQKDIVKAKFNGSPSNMENGQNNMSGPVVDEDSPSGRVVRNRSEHMKSKDGKSIDKKGTKSQNLKKNKKKTGGDIMVSYPNGNGDAGSKIQERDGRQKDQFHEDEEPSLPIFKGKRKDGDRQESESDGLEIIPENDKNERGAAKSKNKKQDNRTRRSQSNMDRVNKNRLRGDGNNQVAEQGKDELPHLHASEQLSNLIINKNKAQNSHRQGRQGRQGQNFTNDDESIYNKIYKDETETLKSVQGDNYFGQDISPSQFNVQNQRFDDTDIGSNDMPIKPFISHDLEEAQSRDDGFEDGPEIRRYGSTKNNLNIDYDLVREKRQENERIKELEKIYLPRLEVRAPPARKKK